MEDMVVKNDGRVRLNPPRWHSRYVHLKLMRRNIEYFIDKYIKQRKPESFVDFGCGDMPYEPLISPLVKDYIGVDIEGNPRASKFVNLQTNRVDLSDNCADVLWSIQVLEHVGSPQLYLDEAYRILKSGEKMILSTHGHWLYHPDPIDNWRWTCTGLKKTIQESGFEVIEFRGMMGLLPMSLQLFQDACLIHFPFVKYWKNPFCFVMQILIGMAHRFTMWSKTTRNYVDMDACVFFVIAEKKVNNA